MLLPGALLRDLTGFLAVPRAPWVSPDAPGVDAGVTFQMFGNDDLPDCTIAAIGNFLDLKWYHAGKRDVWPIGAAERMFDLVPPGDRAEGRALLDVLNWWLANGLPDDPLDRPAGFYRVDFSDLAKGINACDAVYTRVLLPMNAAGDDWDWSDDAARAGRPGVGSHCVLALACDARTVRLASYGTRITVSRAWWSAYAQDEAYGINYQARV